MHDPFLYAGLSRGMTVLLTTQPASDPSRKSNAMVRRISGKVLLGLGRRLVAAGEALAGTAGSPEPAYTWSSKQH